MNFLAHLYLSGENKQIQIGNFIADSVRGNHLEKFPHMVKEGIYLHRAIDSYTDQHPVFRQSKHRLQEKYSHYSGVITDMIYDHYLAKNWERFSPVPLHRFVLSAYKLLLINFQILPGQSKKILPHMILTNWLLSYRDLDKMQIFFEGMARRARFNSGMETALNDIRKNYCEYEQEFLEFFPSIINYVDEYQFNHQLISQS